MPTREELVAALAERERELAASLERQTATSEILAAIAASPGDAARALQFIAETSQRLFGAASVSIQLAEGLEFTKEYRVGAAARRVGSAYPRSNIKVGGHNLPGTVVGENRQVHIPDLDNIDPSMSDWPGLPHARAGGTRTMCGTPLRRRAEAIGALIVYRDRLQPFTDEEMALQQTFADQAVIAIENARLFDEVQARTLEVEQSLAQQTATSDVLKTISRSAFDLQVVLDTLVASAFELCGAQLGLIYLRGAEAFECKSVAGLGVEDLRALFMGRPIRAGRGTAAERVIASGAVECVEDYFADPDGDPRVVAMLKARQAAGEAFVRAVLAAPMKRDGEVVGVIAVARSEPGPFPERQIELLQTFADQAVIAIENSRLLEEVQARTGDLEKALGRQTAIAEVLEAINASPGDLAPVFDAIVEKAMRLCDATYGGSWRLEDGRMRPAGGGFVPAAYLEFLSREPVEIADAYGSDAENSCVHPCR